MSTYDGRYEEDPAMAKFYKDRADRLEAGFAADADYHGGPMTLEEEASTDSQDSIEIKSKDVTRYTKGPNWKKFGDLEADLDMVEIMVKRIEKAGSTQDDVGLITWVLSGEPTGQFRELSADMTDRPALSHMDLLQESLEYARDLSGQFAREEVLEKAIKAALTTKIIRKI